MVKLHCADLSCFQTIYQGPRSNFEIGGGGKGSTNTDSILGGGTKHFFLLILYNFKNIGGGMPPNSMVPVNVSKEVWW